VDILVHQIIISNVSDRTVFIKILNHRGVFLPSELASLYFGNGGYVLDTLRVVFIVPGLLINKV
jgi:hypothetical protein